MKQIKIKVSLTNQILLDKILKKKIFYDVDGYKCHIVLYNKEAIVWKYYGKNKHRWFYECSSFDMFEYNMEYLKRFNK